MPLRPRRPRPRLRPRLRRPLRLRRRRPMATGYAPRPLRRRRRRLAYALGGQVQPQGRPGRRRPPPRPPGATGFDAPPPRPMPAPSAARPPRGAPMMAPGGPRPAPMGRGPLVPGNMISPNGMPPPVQGGMQRPIQRMARGGTAGRRAEPTQGGFVSRELSPSGGSQTDDVDARLNSGEFVIPKDITAWKGKEFFYKLIANSRKMRAGGNEKPQVGYRNGGGGQGQGPRR
jgi:hypothetical protein